MSLQVSQSLYKKKIIYKITMGKVVLELNGKTTSVKEVVTEKGDGEVEHSYSYNISDGHGGRVKVTSPDKIALPNQESVKITIATVQETLEIVTGKQLL